MHYSLARATTWNILGYTYLIIVSLISTPILINLLGLKTFGLYSLVLATLALVSSFDLGLSQAVTRALSINHQFSKTRQTLWATSSLLFLSTGLVAAIVATTICYNLHLQLELLPVIFAISLLSNLVAHYSTLPQAEGHFGYLNVKTFIVGTANTLFAAYLAWRGEGILEIFISLLIGYLLTLGFLAYFSLKYFPHPRSGKASYKVAQSLIQFGLKNQSGKIVGQIQAQYGKYLLRFIAPLQLSAYLIATGIVQKIVGGFTQVATAIYPAVSRDSSSPVLRKYYYQLQLGLFLIGLLGVGVYHIFGVAFLSWWLHNPPLVEVVDRAMTFLVWYFAVLVLCPLPSSILDGTGHPGITSLFATITTVIEISLSLILYESSGYMAPIYASFIALLLTNPALLYVTDRVMRVK